MVALTTPVSVPWRRLTWATWRQHRTALIGTSLLVVLTALVMAVSGSWAHRAAGRHGAAWLAGSPHHFLALLSSNGLVQLLPLAAGAFLGAPLLAREAEAGTTALAWTQGTGRTRWLLARVIPLAAVLGLAAASLGLEFRWWISPLRPGTDDWSGERFYVNPLPLAGWTVLAFTLGVLVGAVLRRTVPAMAVTLLCYGAALNFTTHFLRPYYLAPLHRMNTIAGSPGASYGVYWSAGRGPGPYYLDSGPGWPDGRLLTQGQLQHSQAWYTLHHITTWTVYQPASRYGLFQLIEFGWLTVLSLLLVAATVAIVRRRAA
ncbi:MAG TPA: hypothetical protein VF834_01625 [Streptosporangiaceae bacterium]